MSAPEIFNDPDGAARWSVSSSVATLRDWLMTSAGVDRANPIVPTADSPEVLGYETVGGWNGIGDAQQDGAITNPSMTHATGDQAAVIAQMVADLEISTHGGAAGPIDAPMPSHTDGGQAGERSVMTDATTSEPVVGNEAGSAVKPTEPASLTDHAPDSDPGKAEQIVDPQQQVAGRDPSHDDAAKGDEKVLKVAAIHDIDPGGQAGDQVGDLVETGPANAASPHDVPEFAKPDAIKADAVKPDAMLGLAAATGAELALPPDLTSEADSNHLPKMLNEHFAAAEPVADQPAPDAAAPVPEQPHTAILSSGAYFVDVVALARYGMSNADMVNAVFAGQEHQLQH